MNVETLPNGVGVLIVSCDGYGDFKTLSRALSYNGRTYGRTGWNSDHMIAYYRSDAVVAF